MAKRFTYRFETLLRLRRQREDQQKRVVASRLRQIEAVRRRQAALQRQIARQTLAVRRCLVEERMDVDRLLWGRHWLARLRQGVLEAEAEISTHRAVLAQERAELTNARKSTKVLERLKERRREAHLAAEARSEQIELDDMNVTRFVHSAFSQESAALAQDPPALAGGSPHTPGRAR